MTNTENIQSLRDEAGTAGDNDMVAICDRALNGDTAAITQCEQAIADAKANW